MKFSTAVSFLCLAMASAFAPDAAPRAVSYNESLKSLRMVVNILGIVNIIAFSCFHVFI
jgi:hypothetical protein